jgi:hypothetical protein
MLSLAAFLLIFVRMFVCYSQLEAIAVDPDAEGGVGSASGMQLLNMDLSRRAAAGAAQQEDEAAAATQVSAHTKWTALYACWVRRVWRCLPLETGSRCNPSSQTTGLPRVQVLLLL